MGTAGLCWSSEQPQISSSGIPFPPDHFWVITQKNYPRLSRSQEVALKIVGLSLRAMLSWTDTPQVFVATLAPDQVLNSAWLILINSFSINNMAANVPSPCTDSRKSRENQRAIADNWSWGCQGGTHQLTQRFCLLWPSIGAPQPRCHREGWWPHLAAGLGHSQPGHSQPGWAESCRAQSPSSPTGMMARAAQLQAWKQNLQHPQGSQHIPLLQLPNSH